MRPTMGTNMSKMLINATHPGETRVAIVENNRLTDLLFEQKRRKKADIHKGRITRIEPSLEAAFVDYGHERHGFLPLKEIPSAIRNNLKEGQEVLVQIDKEERGSKGAALSMLISLAGSYLVLMPNNSRAGGISRRIEGEERAQLKELFQELTVPDGMGTIIRTAGIGRSLEELQWDLDYLATLWGAIMKAQDGLPAPALVYQEGNVSIRALRDHFRDDVEEIWVDEPKQFEEIQQLMKWLHPDFAKNVKFHEDKTPLFAKFQIEQQINSIYQREIKLSSGASIVVDRAEALVAIDINSARATKGGNIEETALAINLEAADEIARQLRLRDLGGLVVIDFIDMQPIRHQREVEDRLTKALSRDRARVQVGRISRFGLLELSRQRLGSSIGETTQDACPRCHGRGTIRNVESIAVSILRLIEDAVSKEATGQVHVQVPVAVATYLLNEKRGVLSDLEREHSTLVLVIPNRHMKTPAFEINRVKANARTLGQRTKSHTMIAEGKQDAVPDFIQTDTSRQESPAVKGIAPAQPAPTRTAKSGKKESSLLSRIFQRIFSVDDDAKKAKPAAQTERKPATQQRRQSSGNRNQRGRGQNRNQQNRNQQNRNQQNRRSPNQSQDDADNNNQRQNNNNRQRNTNQNQRRRNTSQTSTVQRDRQPPATTSQPGNEANKPMNTIAEQQGNTGTREDNKRPERSEQRNDRRRTYRRRSQQKNRPAQNEQNVTTEAPKTEPVQKTTPPPAAPVEKPQATQAAPKAPEKKPRPTAARRRPSKPTQNTEGFVQVESSATSASKPASAPVKAREVASKPREHRRVEAKPMDMVETRRDN